jgi:hypothetical protein
MTTELNQFDITWHDSGREPQCPPDPAYPQGIDINAAAGEPCCKVRLPYPAKRCGFYAVRCRWCGFSVILTTAGRPDDPRSVTMPCFAAGTKQ